MTESTKRKILLVLKRTGIPSGKYVAESLRRRGSGNEQEGRGGGIYGRAGEHQGGEKIVVHTSTKTVTDESTHTYMHACARVHTYTYTHTYAHTHVHINIHTLAETNTHTAHTHTQARTCIHTHRLHTDRNV